MLSPRAPSRKTCQTLGMGGISLFIILGSGLLLKDQLEKRAAGEQSLEEATLMFPAITGYIASHGHNVMRICQKLYRNGDSPPPAPAIWSEDNIKNLSLGASSVLFLTNNIMSRRDAPPEHQQTADAAIAMPLCFLAASCIKGGLHTLAALGYTIPDRASYTALGLVLTGGAIFSGIGAAEPQDIPKITSGLALVASTALAIGAMACGTSKKSAAVGPRTSHDTDPNSSRDSSRYSPREPQQSVMAV